MKILFRYLNTVLVRRDLCLDHHHHHHREVQVSDHFYDDCRIQQSLIDEILIEMIFTMTMEHLLVQESML